jgi:hypothetical protein
MIVWAIVLFLSVSTAFADFIGPVVSVLDGDTIEVLPTPTLSGSV